MSAGYIQLTALGQQDVYLTGNPSQTYFLGRYSRHTPFVLEAYDVPFIGDTLLFGTQAIAKIPYKGDIIRGLTLKTQLPQLHPSGSDFSYPTPAGQNFFPRMMVWRTSSGADFYAYSPFTTLNFYSTANRNLWLDNGYIGYLDPVTAKQIVTYILNPGYQFQFSNCFAVEVEPVNGINFNGVFWGLDPKNPSAVTPSGNLVYYVNNTPRIADFSLVQSGWVAGTGVPSADTRAAFTMNVSNLIVLTDLNKISVTSQNTYSINVNSQSFTTYGYSAYASRTPGGTIMLDQTGTYSIRGSLITDGPLYSVSYGLNLYDAHPPPSATFYQYTHKSIMSPNKSMPFSMPINITSIPQYLYIDVSTDPSATGINVSSFIDVGPLDTYFTSNLNWTVGSSVVQVPLANSLYFNQYSTKDLMNTWPLYNTFQFKAQGTYTMSCYFEVQQASTYVLQVSYGVANSNGTRPTNPSANGYVYTYSTIQGRNPTFDFVLPITVTNNDVGTTWWYIDLTLSGSSATILGSNASWITFVQGANDASQAFAPDFPYRGVVYRPSSTLSISNGPLNIGNLTPYGHPYDFTVSGTSIQFSNLYQYMVTAVVWTADPLSSISFGSYVHQIEVGLLPPYTFMLPLTITSTSDTLQINVSFQSSTTSLLTGTYIGIAPYASNVTQSFQYYDSVGTYIIQQAELKIGGQSIEKISGEYIELWNDLNVPYENQPGLTLLTGKLDTSNVYAPRTYYTNLPFYFFGNPELSIPIAAINRQDIEIYITFRNFNQLTSASTSNVAVVLNATIIVEYGYLSDNEIQWMRKNRLDYFITQVQETSFRLPAGFSTGVFQLPFLNPIRELFFVFQRDGQPNYDFTQIGLQNMALSFNGQEFFGRDQTDALYLGTIEPYNHHRHFPDRNFYMYSFTVDPDDPRPTGQINFSRIKQVLLEVNMIPNPTLGKNFRIYAVSFNVLRIENGIAGLLFNVYEPTPPLQ